MTVIGRYEKTQVSNSICECVHISEKAVAKAIKNVFKLLQECSIPVAYKSEDGKYGYFAAKCKPLDGTTIVKRFSSEMLRVSSGFSGAEVGTMKEIAIKAFLVLEKAWGAEELYVRFGLTLHGTVVLTDLVEFKSRELIEGPFRLPKQQLILYRGFIQTPTYNSVKVQQLTHASSEDEKLSAVRDIADGVIIAFFGNIPTFCANTTIPVINVVNAPGDEGLALNASNARTALLEALKILSIGNPEVYMHLEYEKLTKQ